MDGKGVELSEEKVKELVAASLKAKERSYSPYSNYRVGCALLTTDGTVFTGRWCTQSLRASLCGRGSIGSPTCCRAP